MAQIVRLTCDASAAGERLDTYLARQLPELSRSRLQALMEEGAVLCGQKSVRKNVRLTGGEEIVLTLPEPKKLELEPEQIPLCIVYEDDSLLVVNKPKGMVVHPAAGHESGTLVHALLYHCGDSLSGINGVMRPGIVHRIDKDTSGLLVVAKTDLAHQHLAEQIKSHQVRRVYHAIVQGGLPQQEGTIDRPIGRHPVERKKMAVTEKNSKPAITHYRVLERFAGYTYGEFRLETGRTHQIRVHLSSIGHPILGDEIYGAGRSRFVTNGQCLHAKEISFTHPITGIKCEFSCPLPAYFEQILQYFRNQG